jgi:hypothetical protein
MRTVIVLIPVDYDNAKEMAEYLINKEFEKEGDVRKYIDDNGKFDDFDDYSDVISNVDILSINEFVSGINDQTYDVMSEYFVANVNLEIW